MLSERPEDPVLVGFTITGDRVASGAAPLSEITGKLFSLPETCLPEGCSYGASYVAVHRRIYITGIRGWGWICIPVTVQYCQMK